MLAPNTALGIEPVKFCAVKLVKLAPETAPKEPDHVPDVTVPTDVKLDVTTVEFKIVPVSVPAAAVTVPELPKLIAVPLTVTELFVNAEFGMDVNDAPDPENAVDVNVPVLGLKVNLVLDVFATVNVPDVDWPKITYLDAFVVVSSVMVAPAVILVLDIDDILPLAANLITGIAVVPP